MARLSDLRARLAGGPERLRARQAQDERITQLEQQVARLEQENVDLRRHSMRTAELLDVVEELLLPLATRDQDRIDEAVERFRRSL